MPAEAPTIRRATTKVRNPRLRKLATYLMLSVLALVVLFPVYVAIVGSLLLPEQLAQRPPTLFPTDPQWHTYSDAWSTGRFSRFLVNSFVVTGIITVGQVVTSILAGYAFAVLEFPFKRTIFVVFLATMMIPFEVTILTNVATISELNLFSTYPGLAIPFLATGFGAFLLRQAFLQIPTDLRDAAVIDGYGHMKFLAFVAIPLARPTIAALGVFSFLGAWNQYLWPLLITRDEDLRTVQIGLKYLQGESLAEVPRSLAGTVLAALPLILLLFVFQKQLIRGLTAGAVKG